MAYTINCGDDLRENDYVKSIMEMAGEPSFKGIFAVTIKSELYSLYNKDHLQELVEMQTSEPKLIKRLCYKDSVRMELQFNFIDEKPRSCFFQLNETIGYIKKWRYDELIRKYAEVSGENVNELTKAFGFEHVIIKVGGEIYDDNVKFGSIFNPELPRTIVININ